ncbi:hypothetical protein GP486_003592 [Trichoglossum hirsutum]|uniref:Multiple RNA-binding domain-containing protein 1 n=1 Tax=Trichoglossum hirsutum TaxID=265104 RepID=A0A9P8RQH3_9PEZI|nr:hypothetical protein GP486_003592 [Trichoglossum hirsutum]
MESSRIFVRGLPPKLTEDDFRRHFSTQWNLTDARLIPHRRIGYVGYKTPEEAVKAAEYFDKSFIRMSRIGVEIAHPVDDGLSRPQNAHNRGLARPKKKSNSSNDIPSPISRNSLKRRRDGQEDIQDDPKLQEFLEVMQPPSRSKIWMSEGTAGAMDHNVSRDLAVQGTESEDNTHYEASPKKSRKAIGYSRGEHQTDSASQHARKTIYEPADELSVSNEHKTVMGDVAHTTEKAENFAEQHTTSISDADWLRSRTSRLLDLQSDAKDSDHSKTPGTSSDPNSRSGVGDAQRRNPGHTAQAVNDLGKESTERDGRDALVEAVAASRRLFVRNLSYGATEDDLRDHFSPFGDLEEVHLAIDPKTGLSKGFAYILYLGPPSAVQAYQALDGKIFQGRLLHILPASPKRGNKLDEYAISQLPLKKQKLLKKKAEAAASLFNWNSLYMNTDAVMSSISDRLGVSKSDLLDPTSADAAVKQAHAETHIIQETKAYFSNNNIDLNAFRKGDRGDTAILVKNFPYGVGVDELRNLFEEYGQIKRLLMPPAGTIAIVEFAQAPQARAAFATLAYRRFKNSVLFLEKAPKGLFIEADTNAKTTESTSVESQAREPKLSASDLLQASNAEEVVDTTTLFVRNLNFTTTTERLTEAFRPLDGLLSAKVKTKPDPKKPGQVLSMGFGFLEFRTKEQAQAAMAAMDGYNLDGHRLLIKASHKLVDAAEERRRADRAKKLAGRRTKIIIKNLPFEATKKDVRSLFSAYGQLRSVRVPKKFDSSARGFAFADFVTAREAENAMEALGDTHLLGRKLVLEFAAGDPLDAEEEIEKMQKKVRKQADKVALQRLTGGGRKKFNIGENDDVENA